MCLLLRDRSEQLWPRQNGTLTAGQMLFHVVRLRLSSIVNSVPDHIWHCLHRVWDLYRNGAWNARCRVQKKPQPTPSSIRDTCQLDRSRPRGCHATYGARHNADSDEFENSRWDYLPFSAISLNNTVLQSTGRFGNADEDIDTTGLNIIHTEPALVKMARVWALWHWRRAHFLL